MPGAFGPTFKIELAAAGLSGLPFSWNSDGTISGRANLTGPQSAALDGVIAAHNPNSLLLSVIPFDTFILRWLPAEYLALQQKRVLAGAGALCQQWDVSMVRGIVDLNSAAAQNFKAALVSAAVLTQPRADTIFS